MKISGRQQDDAVSEIIGTVLLISIVVLAASVIAVAVFSQPQAQKIPALSALISNQSQVVSIKHDGGESLANGTYKILVDGTDVTSSITIPSTWSIGETLTYTKPGTTPPSSVVIVYTGYSSSGVVLTSAYFGQYTGGGVPTGTTPATTTATPTPGTSHNINASISGTGGSILPVGTVPVAYGASQTFNITANSGYHISDVSVDGSSVGAVSSYPFTNVVANHTITASFALNAPTLSGITPSSGVTGTSVSITNLAGTNFSVTGTTLVQLKMGTTTIAATSVNAISSTQITCTFSLAGAATGAWDVVVTNPDGQTATLSSGFTVTSNIISASNVVVNANGNPGKPGYLLSGGYIQFTVAGTYYITHGGTVHTLINGDTVRLTINSGGTQGTMYTTSNTINTFNFNNVDLTINGVDYGQNTITNIYIGSYSSFTSTLTLNVPSQSAQTEFDANGACVICNAVSSTPITVYNLGMGSGGINLGPMTTIYYTGGATGYSLS